MHVEEEPHDARVSEVTDSDVGVDSWIWLYGELLETNRALQSSLIVNMSSGSPLVDGVSMEEVLLLRGQFERLEKRLRFWSSRRKRRRQTGHIPTPVPPPTSPRERGVDDEGQQTR